MFIYNSGCMHYNHTCPPEKNSGTSTGTGMTPIPEPVPDIPEFSGATP